MNRFPHIQDGSGNRSRPPSTFYGRAPHPPFNHPGVFSPGAGYYPSHPPPQSHAWQEQIMHNQRPPVQIPVQALNQELYSGGRMMLDMGNIPGNNNGMRNPQQQHLFQQGRQPNHQHQQQIYQPMEGNPPRQQIRYHPYMSSSSNPPPQQQRQVANGPNSHILENLLENRPICLPNYPYGNRGVAPNGRIRQPSPGNCNYLQPRFHQQRPRGSSHQFQPSNGNMTASSRPAISGGSCEPGRNDELIREALLKESGDRFARNNCLLDAILDDKIVDSSPCAIGESERRVANLKTQVHLLAGALAKQRIEVKETKIDCDKKMEEFKKSTEQFHSECQRLGQPITDEMLNDLLGKESNKDTDISTSAITGLPLSNIDSVEISIGKPKAVQYHLSDNNEIMEEGRSSPTNLTVIGEMKKATNHPLNPEICPEVYFQDQMPQVQRVPPSTIAQQYNYSPYVGEGPAVGNVLVPQQQHSNFGQYAPPVNSGYYTRGGPNYERMSGKPFSSDRLYNGANQYVGEGQYQASGLPTFPGSNTGHQHHQQPTTDQALASQGSRMAKPTEQLRCFLINLVMEKCQNEGGGGRGYNNGNVHSQYVEPTNSGENGKTLFTGGNVTNKTGKITNPILLPSLFETDMSSSPKADAVQKWLETVHYGFKKDSDLIDAACSAKSSKPKRNDRKKYNGREATMGTGGNMNGESSHSEFSGAGTSKLVEILERPSLFSQDNMSKIAEITLDSSEDGELQIDEDALLLEESNENEDKAKQDDDDSGNEK